MLGLVLQVTEKPCWSYDAIELFSWMPLAESSWNAAVNWLPAGTCALQSYQSKQNNLGVAPQIFHWTWKDFNFVPLLGQATRFNLPFFYSANVQIYSDLQIFRLV